MDEKLREKISWAMNHPSGDLMQQYLDAMDGRIKFIFVEVDGKKYKFKINTQLRLNIESDFVHVP